MMVVRFIRIVDNHLSYAIVEILMEKVAQKKLWLYVELLVTGIVQAGEIA